MLTPTVVLKIGGKWKVGNLLLQESRSVCGAINIRIKVLECNGNVCGAFVITQADDLV